MEQPTNSDDLCDIAQAHHQAGRLSEAEVFYRKALEVDPGHPGALYYLGGLAYEDGRYELAFDLIEGLIADEPDDAEGLHLLGLIASRLGQIRLAIESIENALKLEPGFTYAHYSLGEIWLAQNEVDRAAGCFEQALAQNPQFAEAHCGAGRIAIIRQKLPEASAHFRRAIAANPNLAVAHRYLASSLQAQGLLDDAVASYRQALSLNPDAADLHFLLGGALHDQGRRDAAIDCLERAVAIKPDFAQAHYQLAAALKAQDRIDDAIASYQRVVNLQPDFATAYMEMGALQQCRGELDAAVANYRRAVALAPDIAALHNNLGLALQGLGQLDQAAASYRRALDLQPDSATLHHDLAIALHNLKRLDEAADSFRSAIALDPDMADAHIGLGILLHEQGKTEEAIASHRRAISLRPDAVRAHLNLASTLHAAGRYDEAADSCRHAIALQPDHAEAHNQLGDILRARNEVGDAITNYRQAIALQPDLLAAHLNLGAALFDQGHVPEAAACFQRAHALEPDHAGAFSDHLMTIQYLPDATPEQLFARHLAFAERYEAPLRAEWPAHTGMLQQPRRLKIGFVSGDFCVHPVGCFLEGVLRHVDRNCLDITLYSNNDWSDFITERLRAHTSAWVPISRLSDAEAAARIRDDGIDILVDLAGHTGKGRLLVFARKPAPLQVTWLGYWATTGLQAIDYILGDRYGIPADEARFYVEKPWYLPDTRLCFTQPPVDVATNALPALGAAPVTFGCFNNLAKMNDAVVALWAKILRALPQARLLLKSNSLSDPAGRQHVADRFALHGVPAEQLLLEGKSSYDQYLAAYHRVDIALDPFPFTGGATSFDALWMGVPVITLHGDRLIARQGEGMLHNLGMSDWVAADEDAYVAMAVARASDLAGLADLRARLRDSLLQSPLCDTVQFARNLQDAFENMWRARGTND